MNGEQPQGQTKGYAWANQGAVVAPTWTHTREYMQHGRANSYSAMAINKARINWAVMSNFYSTNNHWPTMELQQSNRMES